LQLFASLYVNVSNGLERQFHSNILSLALACARGFGAVMVLLFISATVEAYFATQLVAILLMLIVSAITAWQLLPPAKHPAVVRPGMLPSTWHATRSLTGAAIPFVFSVSSRQADRQRHPASEDFGHYVSPASCEFDVGDLASVGTALTPRFTRLLTLRAEEQVRSLFHSASQFVGLILLPIAVLAIFHAEPLIFLYRWQLYRPPRCSRLPSF
jgi:hypothetical protein